MVVGAQVLGRSGQREDRCLVDLGMDSKCLAERLGDLRVERCCYSQFVAGSAEDLIFMADVEPVGSLRPLVQSVVTEVEPGGLLRLPT